MSGCGCGQPPIAIGGCQPPNPLPSRYLPRSQAVRALRDDLPARLRAVPDPSDRDQHRPDAVLHHRQHPCRTGPCRRPDDPEQWHGRVPGRRRDAQRPAHLARRRRPHRPGVTARQPHRRHDQRLGPCPQRRQEHGLAGSTAASPCGTARPPSAPISWDRPTCRMGGDDNGVIPPTAVPLADVLAGRVVVELNLETGNDDACRVGPKQWTVDSLVLTVQASAPGCGRPFLRTTCRTCDGTVTCTTDTLDGSTPYAPVPPVVPVASCQDGCATALPPCISTDRDNAIVRGSDGCLYAPDTPSLDPSPCNAARNTTGGLLVPRVDLSGLAPGGNVGVERSVDIDVTGASGCPERWEIGARLTPVSAFRNAERQHADLLARTGTDVPIPESDIVLPEAGCLPHRQRRTVRARFRHRRQRLHHRLAQGRDHGHPPDELHADRGDQRHEAGTAGRDHAHHDRVHGRLRPPDRPPAPDVRPHRREDLRRRGRMGTDSNGATRMRFLKVRD